MTFNYDAPKPNDAHEFTTQAADATQYVAEVSAELDDEASTRQADQLGLEDETVDAAVEDGVCDNRAHLQTREAYLKKGEDLIRSLL